MNNGDGTFREDDTAYSERVNVNVTDSKFVDIDNDGFLDLLIASRSSDGLTILHNDRQAKFNRLNIVPSGIGSVKEVKFADYNEDGDMDIFMSTDKGLKLLRNDGGNANRHLKIQLVGLRTGSSKNNHFGIGSKVEVRVGDQYQMRTVTEPVVHFGLANHEAADVVRILWTNGVPQNIFTPLSDQDLVEEQILKGSCPFLYTWNGDEYVFNKDIMWRSALGMPLGIMSGETAYAFSDASKDYIKIPGELMGLKDGKYSLQITAELWETIYFDQVRLVAVDHPEWLEIFVDEKFSPPPFPSLEIHQVGQKYTPTRAYNEKGDDLLALITAHDDKYVSDLNLNTYQGTTQLHDLVLDLGLKENKDQVKLYLNGWIFPSDASINVAIDQSKAIENSSTWLQVIDESGEWVTVIEKLGFPMGKDKTIIADLSGLLKSEDTRVRIRTTMQIYWDYIFFTTSEPDEVITTTTMESETADLHYRGFSALSRKGGRYGPHWFNYNEVSNGQIWRDLTGNYTRYGEVNELLKDKDSMYIIANAGDEVTLEFDPTDLPDLPEGWKRDFLIYSVGWVKDGDLNTANGQTVEPLPFHEMTRYPYDTSREHYPTGEEYINYRNRYNTREVSTKDFGRALRQF